jgi:hypothetical protein
MLVVVGALLLTLAAPLVAAAAEGQRTTYNFNPGWRMHFGEVAGAEGLNFADGGWRVVTLPKAFNEDEAFKVAINRLTHGITWYRKTFTVPAIPAGGRLFIEFEGVRQAGEVYVNGTHVGRHENGAMAFGFDITPHVRSGQRAVIAVRVDSAWRYQEKATGTGFQWNHTSFNVNYGGIPKNVKLHVTGPVHQTLPLWSNLQTTGVYVYGSNYDVPGGAADITARTQVRNETTAPRTFQYRVRIRDAAGKLVEEFGGERHTLAGRETREIGATARVSGLNFWSWGYGYLYDVETALLENGRVIDAVNTRTGFRKTDFSKGMVTLNDRVIQIKGYAQRTTNEWPALGTNIPHWLSDYSNHLMIESGANTVRWMHITPSKQDVESSDRVGLIQAMPAGDSERDVTGRQWEHRVELMREAIIYNRNNPSILFYEGGNENISEAHMAELKAIRDRFDPHGGRAIGSREMLDSKIAEYGGEMLYINKSAGKPLWATEYSRDEGARLYQDEFTPPFHKDGPAYNRNQDSHAIENVERWYDYWRERPGSGPRTSAGGVNIIFSDSNTHYRGDNNYRRSGEVDAMRIPKEGFFVHRVMWDGWVDVETPRTHIIGHWTYAPGVRKDVSVVSSSPQVELFVNNRSLGRQQPHHGFLFTFKDVAFEPGVIRAVSYDAAGKPASSYQVETAGPAVALRLKAITGPNGLKADGADVALVDVEVVDARGRRVPTALHPVSFQLAGPAEWRGGIAQGRPDNYILAKTLPVEGGVNRVALRAGSTPGTIRLTATAEGLRPATMTLGSEAFRVANGMTTALPGADEPVRLTRGPTPAGPSFRPWRKGIAIRSATAGSNSDTARNTIDDNEISFWKSDGGLDKAWIEYEFAQPATVGEITFRLVGFRLRSYPMRITLDGATVYEGEPAKTLGYVTVPLARRTGRRLRVQLTKPTVDRDSFGNIIELVPTARAGADSGAEQVPSGAQLSIFEAEVYEPATAGDLRVP